MQGACDDARGAAGAEDGLSNGAQKGLAGHAGSAGGAVSGEAMGGALEPAATTATVRWTATAGCWLRAAGCVCCVLRAACCVLLYSTDCASRAMGRGAEGKRWVPGGEYQVRKVVWRRAVIHCKLLTGHPTQH